MTKIFNIKFVFRFLWENVKKVSMTDKYTNHTNFISEQYSKRAKSMPM